MEAATTQLLIKALTIVIPQAAIMLMLYFWLRQEIRRHGQRSNEQGKYIKTSIADVSALQATVEIFFRVRIDPPQPPDKPGAAQTNKAN